MAAIWGSESGLKEGVGASIQNQGCVPCKKGNITQQFEYLDVNIVHIKELVENLVVKLAPTILDQPCSTSDSAKSPPMSQMAEAMSGLNTTLGEIKKRLSTLLEAIDL